MGFKPKASNILNNISRNATNIPPMRPPTHNQPPRPSYNNRNSTNLMGGLIGGMSTMIGSAVGSAIGQAMQPAMNNIGESVASSIKQNAGTATKSLVDVAQAQKSMAKSQEKIANKKETKKFEYFEECPYCGAGREGQNTVCEYCGTSLVKNEETHIE